MDCSTPGFPVLDYLPEFAQTPVHCVGDAIQPSYPLLSPSPPAFDLSQHQVLCLRWPKYYSFSFSISPSNEYSGRISFRIDWLDLLAVQGTLKSLLQHHSSKASILWHSAFFIVFVCVCACMCIYTYKILNCCSCKFEQILTTLHILLPLHPSCLDIIFYIILCASSNYLSWP